MDNRRRDFGPRLKAWRHATRRTQQSLAEELGYDKTYIVKIEAGTRPPSRQFLARMAQLRDAPIDASLLTSVDDIARPLLPSPPDPLVGRDDDVNRIKASLTGVARCVTLVGPPGIGKSRLALEIATQLDSRFRGGAWWIPLLDVEDPDDVVVRVRQELGIPDPGAADPVDGLVARLRSHQALLVLDNFERVLAARQLVSALVAAAPELVVLVTSQEPLGLASEHIYPVKALDCPDPLAGPSLEEIAASNAVALFVARARMANPGFELTSANGHAVARTCALLDGIPLAIVLAAGGVATEGLAGTERAARRHLNGFVPTLLDLAPHHRTLRTAVARSWELLTTDEAHLLCRLAIFSGGFTRDAASAVSGPATGQALDALVRKSLVEARPDAPGDPRYELLDTIRSFAFERLRDAGGLDEAHERHLAYFLALAETCGQGMFGRRQAQCIQVFAQETDNLRVAFEWAENRAPDEALRLAVSTWRFFLTRDLPRGRRWLRRALAASTAASYHRAEALAAAGALAWVTGHLQDSEAHLDDALTLARELGSPTTEALAWLNKGALEERRDRSAEADRCFIEALRLYQSAGDERGRACALVGRGMICRRRGVLDEACDFWMTAMRLFAEVGDRFNQTMALGNLAWAADRDGRLDEAQDWLAECRRIQIALGDARGLATTTAGLARLAYRRGTYEESARLASEALIAFQRLGDRPSAASTLISLAGAVVRQGRWRPALRLIGAADALWEIMGATARDEDVDLRAEVVEECRRHLNAGETTRAVGVGRAMTIEDAVELADASS